TGRRERTEWVFGRGKLDDASPAECALDLLDRLPRLVRDEVGERPPEEALLDLGHARSLCAARALLVGSTAAEKPERAPHGAEERGDKRLVGPLRLGIDARDGAFRFSLGDSLRDL